MPQPYKSSNFTLMLLHPLKSRFYQVYDPFLMTTYDRIQVQGEIYTPLITGMSCMVMLHGGLETQPLIGTRLLCGAGMPYWYISKLHAFPEKCKLFCSLSRCDIAGN